MNQSQKDNTVKIMHGINMLTWKEKNNLGEKLLFNCFDCDGQGVAANPIFFSSLNTENKNKSTFI